MGYDFGSKIDIIAILEGEILGSKQHHSAWLDADLKQLRDARKDLYNLSGKKVDNDMRSQLLEEYKYFCNFNYSLLTTERMSDNTYFDIIHSFLKDYSFVKPIDKNGKARDLTLSTLKRLKLSFKISDNRKINYHRLNYVKRTINQFEEKYGLKEKGE